MVPQLGQHRGVAAPVGREHQPEHEQHHQQRVEGPPALDPLPVVRARHAHQGADQLLPELHEARPGPRRAAARLGRLGRALLQDPAPVRMQRVHVHILGRLGRHSAHRPARLRLADALPVGCPVAGPLMLPRVHVGLGQHRPAAVPPLPVLRQLPQRQPQGLRRQALHLDPREQHEASVAHHQVEMPVVPADRPADPLVAAAHVAGGEVEQQAAQLALLAIEQEVAQMRAQRLPIAQRVVALHPFVPLRDRLRLGHRLQLQGRQAGQRPVDQRPRRGAAGQLDRLLPAAPAMPLGRQAQDTEPLQLFQQAQGALEAVAAAGRPPAQVLADGTPQLGAAQLGEAPDGDLDVSELLAGEALAQKGGRFEILDQRVHASRSPRPYLGKPAGICQVLPGGIAVSCTPLQAKDEWAGDENLTIHHLHLMPLTGQGAYIGSRPSKASVQSICRKISEWTSPRNGQLSREEMVERLNRCMTGWANYFRLGQVSPAYNAIDRHAVRRLRQWLCRKHKVKTGKYVLFPDRRLYGEYGLVRLALTTTSLPWAKA